MVWLILAIIIYLGIIPIAYKKVYDEDNTKFENWWFATIWPLMAIGWICTGWTK